MSLSHDQIATPPSFKGIALFTPGGDLIYCIDPSKQERWHLHLCAGLQAIFDLPEPPHFLVPGYTATVDCWLDKHSFKTFAEVYPAVQRYQTLLNAVFGLDIVWQMAPWLEEACSPIVIESYRHRFPQLWEEHDLVVHLADPPTDLRKMATLLNAPKYPYVLRLFVSGNSQANERIFKTVHQFLEQGLGYPYTLKIIDISKQPEQAEQNQVSATPTLMRVLPQPVRRVVGELDDVERVLQILKTF